MKKVIFIIFILLMGELLSKEIIKIGSFTLEKVEKKEVKTKIENIIIEKIEDNIIYLREGKIKMKETIDNLIISNPKFITDLSGNPKKVDEIQFPVVADIETITMQGEFLETPEEEPLKVLKIIIKGKTEKEK